MVAAGKPSLLVTGGAGFVAGSVIARAVRDWQVHVFSRGHSLCDYPGLVWHTIDFADREPMHRLFQAIQPTTVIHLAAIADIDYCENHPEEATRVNTEYPAALAHWCVETSARLVYVSTDNVFDGRQGRYRENDPAEPVNHYGRTKLNAEAAVLTAPNFVIARLALVMGLPILGRGNAFLVRMIETLESGETLYVPDAEIRSPVDVITAGRALVELASSDFRGTLHLAGNDIMNRCEMARQIAKRLGYSPDQVQPHDPQNVQGRARRPRDVSLNNARARSVLQTPMLGLDDAVTLMSEQTDVLRHALDRV